MKVSDIKKSAYKGKGSIWKPLLLLFIVCAMPVYYLFINNIGKIKFVEAAVLMGLAYAVGLTSFGIIHLFIRNRFISGLIASVCLFLFMNFSIIYNFVHKNIVQVHAGYISYALAWFFAFILSIVLISFSLKYSWLPKKTTDFFLVISVFTILVNTVFAAPSIIKIAGSSKTPDISFENDLDYNIKPSSDTVKPNIYFFIADEYASFSCMKKYYNYDNIEFYNFLSDNKFNISETSYSYHIDTYKCLADLTALQSVEGISTANALKKQILKDDNLQYRLLKKLGYNITEVSTQNMYPFQRTNKNDIISNIFNSQTAGGDSSLKLILERSMLYWFSDYLSLLTYTTSKSVTDYFTDGKYLKNDSPTAYLCYMISPHTPFTNDENGNKISSSRKEAWGMPEIYLGQLKYTTKLIMSAAENILINDPGSIIILQSDHGVRYHPDGVPPHSFIIEETDMRSILNTVYYEGKSLNIEGLSAVNTWRTVFNKLGVEINLLDDSSYKIAVDENADVVQVQ